MEQAIHIRAATPDEDSLIAQHFYQLWRDNEVSENLIEANWREIVLQFLDRARRDLQYKAWFAEVEGQVIGSVGCQLFAGLYPNALKAEYRKYGYIWGVYVEPPYRGRGIARELTERAIGHLQSLGCTQAILHASRSGKSVYEGLGFTASNEMRLDLN
jgi:GNAT superfamily N-acetyltransferase